VESDRILGNYQRGNGGGQGIRVRQFEILGPTAGDRVDERADFVEYQD